MSTLSHIHAFPFRLRNEYRPNLLERATQQLPPPDTADKIVGRCCAFGLALFVLALFF